MLRLGGSRSTFLARLGHNGFVRKLPLALVPVALLTGVAMAPASGAGRPALGPEMSGGPKTTPLAGGLYNSMAVTSDGRVYSWGWNIVGQLGDGSTNGSDVPVKVKLPGSMRVTRVAEGLAHSIALTSSGVVFAWGKNYDGNLGDGTTADSAVPVKVNLPAGIKVTEIAAGVEQNLAVTSSGGLLAWGGNNFGQLGNGSSGGYSAVPVTVTLPAGTKAIAVAAGSLHSLVLTSTGAVLAFGFNADGELGDGNKTNSDVPVKVDLPGGAKVIAIAAGAYDSLALTSTGAVYAWGYNADGELGDGGTANSDVPVKVLLPGGKKVTAIAAGGPVGEVGQYVAGPGHCLALTSNGSILAWGYNGDGELGNGSTTNSDVPVKVKLPSGKKVTAIAAGELHSLAVTSSGGVLTWGGNNFGQLGDGNYKGSDVPVKVKLP